MSTINICHGRYSLIASNVGDYISGYIAINDEGGHALCHQEFYEQDLEGVISHVIDPVTGGNQIIASDLRELLIRAGFRQRH